MKTKPRVRDSSGYPAAQRGVGADSPAERECGCENDVRGRNPLRHAQKMGARVGCESGVVAYNPKMFQAASAWASSMDCPLKMRAPWASQYARKRVLGGL